MKKWVVFGTIILVVSFFSALVLSQYSIHGALKQQREAAKATLLKAKKEAMGSATGPLVISNVADLVTSGSLTRVREVSPGRFQEIEPNNETGRANLISTRGVSNLRVTPGGMTPVSTDEATDYLDFKIVGSFEVPDDTDVFCVSCEEGEFMTFDLASFQKGALTDPVLTILDSTGSVIATRDDGRGFSGVSLDSCLNLACPPGGANFYVTLTDRGWMGNTVDPAHGDLSYVLSIHLDKRGELEPNDNRLDPNLQAIGGHVRPAGVVADEAPDEAGDLSPCLFATITDEGVDEAPDVTVVYGIVNPSSDTDCYILCLDAGDVISLDIDGGECNPFGKVLDSNGNVLYNDPNVFDPWMELYSPSGIKVAENDDVKDVDPAILFTSSERGSYVVCVHSVWNNGHPDNVYRLTARLLRRNEVEPNDTTSSAQNINCAASEAEEDEDTDALCLGGGIQLESLKTPGLKENFYPPFKANTTFVLSDGATGTIHTSCSRCLRPGEVYGNLKIVTFSDPSGKIEKKCAEDI